MMANILLRVYPVYVLNGSEIISQSLKFLPEVILGMSYF